MRRFAIIGLTVAIAAGLSACSSSSKSTSTATTPATTAATTTGACGPVPAAAAGFKPVVADTLSVVTSLPGTGFMNTSNGSPTDITSGYEYDIAKCVESDAGLHKLHIRNVPFDAIVAGTVASYDLALSQISITPKRAKVLSFSTPYFESQQGILMRKGESVTTLAEAKKVKWGVESATTAIDLLKKIGVDNPHSYQNLADAYTALQAKQIDAVLIDTAINLGQAARSNGALHVPAQFNQPDGPDHYGAALPKGSANIAAVDAVFKSLKDSGVLSKLVIKDLTADPGTIPVIQVPAG
jgi:polar amino acid transport system substrate-binding protein